MASTNVDQRLEFLKIDDRTRKTISDHRAAIESAVKKSLAAFYKQVRQYPEVRGFFQNDRHMEQASSAQEQHWKRIAAATFDGSYVESVERIGATHARIGLEPRWYIGGYALIIEEIVREMVAASFRSKWKLVPTGGGQLAETLASILKVAMLDIDLGVSTYLEETGRKRTHDLRSAISALAEGLSHLERGDVTFRIAQNLPAEYEQLKTDFNQSANRLQQVLERIAASASGIGTGSAEVSSAAADLSQRTEQQAASLEQTAAALDEITATMKKSAEGAAEAHSVVVAARNDAEISGDIVRRAVAAMGEIDRSAKQINQIIGVIDEIAFQTNLLALNAGVEAARAGEAGRGFAVVASEVRALAQRSADAAKQIKSLISESSFQVESGVELVGEAGNSLVRILDQVGRISQLVSEIANSSREQSSGLAQINTAINQMDQVTQQNAAMVEQSTAASRTLATEAGELVALVGEFNIGERISMRPSGRHSEMALAVKDRAVARSSNRSNTVRHGRALPNPKDANWEEF